MASVPGPDVNIPQHQLASMLDSLYSETVVQERDGSFLRLTSEFLDDLVKIANLLIPADAALKLQRQKHFIQCLSWAGMISSNLRDRNNFDYEIRFSFSALCEVIFQLSALVYGENPQSILWGTQTSYLPHHVKASMSINGWCPSDIFRAELKYWSVQTFSMLRAMERLPKENHNQCSDYECKLSQIIAGKYNLAHQEIGCRCTLLSVDSERLLDILDDGDAFPLLKFTGGLADLELELVSSATRAPYVAISHVGGM